MSEGSSRGASTTAEAIMTGLWKIVMWLAIGAGIVTMAVVHVDPVAIFWLGTVALLFGGLASVSG